MCSSDLARPKLLYSYRENNMPLDQSLQKYYEARFDLFSQQGWQDLMEDVDVMLDAMNNVSTIAEIGRASCRERV